MADWKTVTFPPSAPGSSAGPREAGGEEVQEEIEETSNKLIYTTPFLTEVVKFLLSQLRVANIFFIFISCVDWFGYDDGKPIKESDWGKLSSIVPLSIVVVAQACVTFYAWHREKRKTNDINERTDFKIAKTGAPGPPNFVQRNLESLLPGDLICFEPKEGVKVSVTT